MLIDPLSVVDVSGGGVGRLVLVLALLTALGLDPATGDAQVVSRVSVASDGTQANDDSGFSVISADGRFVVFDSRATNLASPCTSTFGLLADKIFLHDRATRVTTCVSVAPDGGPANNRSFAPALSADGRIIAFATTATNLTGTNPCFIAVRERSTGNTTCASVSSAGVPQDGSAFSPAVNANGRFVAFDSRATNLAAPCTTPVFQIYLRDRVAGTTICISVVSGGGVPGDLDSGSGAVGSVFATPALNAGGTIIAFQSLATNLDVRCTSGLNVFVRDLTGGTTTCVSVSSLGAGGNADSRRPAVSADGRFVTFDSQATNLAAPCDNAAGFPLGGHVFVHDRIAQTTECVSVGPNGAAGDADSLRPALSAEGRFVTFASAAGNLAAPCVGFFQIFVRDRATGTTTCVSVGPDGQPGNQTSFSPAVTVDGSGRFVAFGSKATNFVPGDTNGLSDIFVARLPVGPNWLLTGRASGVTPRVRGFDVLGNPTPLDRAAFDSGFTGGGVRIALGDVDGDGAPDLIVGAGDAPGQGPRVRILSGSTAGTPLAEFDANDPGAPGGVTVAACDLDGQGRSHIVTGPGPGGGTLVRVWRFDPPSGVTPVAAFPAYAASPGGVMVGCADVDGTGVPSVITGPGAGSPPLVRLFAADLGTGGASERTSFLAYPAGFLGGVSIAAGDVRRRGRASIVTGPGPGFPPLVKVWTLTPAGALPPTAGAAALSEQFDDDGGFLGGDAGSLGGLNVGVGDTTGTGGATIVTSSGPGGSPEVTTTDLGGETPQPQQTVMAESPDFRGGIVVAAPPATAAAPPRPFNPLGLRLNRSSFQPGDTLGVELSVSNPGPAIVVDAFFGVLIPPGVSPSFGCPGGDAVAFLGGGGFTLTCLSAPPQTFPALARGATVAAGLPQTTVPNFLASVIPPGAPAGNYVMFLALTRPDALADGGLGGGELLVIVTTGFVIIP